MIISRIQGGLGNQMFQYAAGRALALRLGAELKLDLSWFTNSCEGCTPRQYLLEDAFSLAPAHATPEECARLMWRKESSFSRLLRRIRRHPRQHATTHTHEPHFSYWPGFNALTSPTILTGYWQTEKYFKQIEAIIRRDFVFPAFKNRAVPLAERLCATPNSVAVHVRRGDYISDTTINNYHGVCSPDYYSAALKFVISKTDGIELFLFSDDPEWVKAHFNCNGLPSTVIDFSEHVDEPWHDMHLMSLCRHHIIANSSFSWWGAWLARTGGIICAPQKWFADLTSDKNPVPEAWVKF